MIDIDRLEQRLKFDHENMGDGFRANMMTTEALEIITRLREAEKDAARYRWLRDRCATAQADCLGTIFVMTVRRKEHLFNVDLSIDQAMKEKGDE